MRLNPPTLLLFLCSLILAALALITKFSGSSFPHYMPHQEFWLAIIAYATLMFASLVRGL